MSTTRPRSATSAARAPSASSKGSPGRIIADIRAAYSENPDRDLRALVRSACERNTSNAREAALVFDCIINILVTCESPPSSDGVAGQPLLIYLSRSHKKRRTS